MGTYPRDFHIVCNEAGEITGAHVEDHDTIRDRMMPARPLSTAELAAALPSSGPLIAQISALQSQLTAAEAAKSAAETAKGEAETAKGAAEAALATANARIAELEAAATPANGCSDLQGRLALKAAGKLVAAEPIVASLPADDAARLYWDRALYWREDSPIIAQFAAALGISDAEKTALFAAARNIQV